MKVFISFTILLLATLTTNAQQQMENSMSQYFRNRVLWNPGFTGIDGAKVYALQNRSWIGFENAPVLTNIGGEFNFGMNSSGGVQIMSDVTGILHRTFGVLNYAYRIRFQEEQQLRLGVALSVASDRLSITNTNAGNDPLILNNINSEPQFDGNFGMVYVGRRFTAGASFYRLRENFKQNNPNIANLAYAQLGFTYSIDFGEDDKLNLRPLAQLRLYRETKALFDIGAQFEYDNLINSMLVYQTSGNIRAGAGVKIKRKVEVNFFYNTNTKVANTSSQQYEIGIGIGLGKQE